MKILIPIIGFGKAGGYRVLSELANNWILSGHEVSFLVDERSSSPYFPTAARILRFDSQGLIISEKEFGIQRMFASAGNALSIYANMWKALKKINENYDVVIANHSLTTYPVFLASIKKARKFYYVQAYEPEYYSDKGDVKSKILKGLSYVSYWLPLEKIVNAPIYLKYKNLNAEKWVPPGVDKSIFFRRKNFPKFNSTNKIIIGVIGRAEPEKGTRFVLRAFSDIAEKNKQICLKVAFGNLPKGWSHESAEVVIPANDAELADYYRSVDILVAPGMLQLGACHYPVLEAMSCGTPVVTTGYIPADLENSWIVKIGSSDDIVNALNEIIKTPDDMLRKKLDKAHNDVSQFYWDTVADKFLQMIAR